MTGIKLLSVGRSGATYTLGRDTMSKHAAAGAEEGQTGEPGEAEPLDHARLKTACANCSLRELCVPGAIPPSELERLDALVARRRRVGRGTTLYRGGSPFRALYAIRQGSFKTSSSGAESGTEQITGFQLPGELLGLDGVAFDVHGVDAVALEDSEVCVLPYADLERIARSFPPLQHQLHKVMSREIVRERDVMMMLGSMRAEERVAAFLIGLSERHQRLGYSATAFVLRMTREDIGSYLGLKLETVSRALSRLGEQGLISARGKQVDIADLQGLRDVLGTHVVRRG